MVAFAAAYLIWGEKESLLSSIIPKNRWLVTVAWLRIQLPDCSILEYLNLEDIHDYMQPI